MQRAKHVKLKWQKNSGTGSYRVPERKKDVGVGPDQPLADELNLKPTQHLRGPNFAQF